MSDEVQAAAVLKALAHPDRLRIVEILGRDGPSCVCHLEHALGLRQATISQHLARLRQAGMVLDQRDGLNVYYDLAGPELLAVLQAAHATASASGVAASSERTTRRRPAPGSCRCPKCAQLRLRRDGGRSPALGGIHGRHA